MEKDQNPTIAEQATTEYSYDSSEVHRFEPIGAGTTDLADSRFQYDDWSELARIASVLSRGQSFRAAPTDELSRQDTVSGMEITDPRFDPQSSEFNFLLWARKFVQLLEEKGIKRRR